MVVALASSAATGYRKHILVNRGAPLVNQIRYDPIVKKRVLFTEAKKRKVTETTPLNFSRKPKGL
ncbi:CYFA0S03e02916g1_1 [Cyberlindnera fabianii]|uniref:Large ribosomal subunit protein bL33m n=1 Tax=Cyberlindnera fabianii TaxID=36022 RepID=A0A061AXG8_CYBFA|nr:hypothetical protein BON22_4484 [Cyberlindnera fabianii]CDR39402.1 CYFA0S03e02916g1_1 [Cyberlindnera fabianii]